MISLVSASSQRLSLNTNANIDTYIKYLLIDRWQPKYTEGLLFSLRSLEKAKFRLRSSKSRNRNFACEVCKKPGAKICFFVSQDTEKHLCSNDDDQLEVWHVYIQRKLINLHRRCNAAQLGIGKTKLRGYMLCTHRCTIEVPSPGLAFLLLLVFGVGRGREMVEWTGQTRKFSGSSPINWVSGVLINALALQPGDPGERDRIRSVQSKWNLQLERMPLLFWEYKKTRFVVMWQEMSQRALAHVLSLYTYMHACVCVCARARARACVKESAWLTSKLMLHNPISLKPPTHFCQLVSKTKISIMQQYDAVAWSKPHHHARGDK